MKKVGYLAVAIGMFTLAITGTALASEWKQEAKGWWYQNDDGTYPVNSWHWIDGNKDGVAESYCFDATGYLYTNITTPDGYQVNETGAWIVDGVVQKKVMPESVSNPTGGGVTAGGGSSESMGTVGDDLQYVTKRVNVRSWNNIDGGRMMKYYDFTGWKTFNSEDIARYKESKNYAIDGEFFCPSEIDFPECVLVEIQLKGNSVVKVVPIWIENGERNYGGFSGYGEKGSYIVGRLEWREFEYSDPEYAAQLKQVLTEEAKQRAFEMYPDMIVDYGL